MRRFVIAAQGLSYENEQEFMEYVKSNEFGWWHWIDNFWLITTHDSRVTAGDIQTQLNKTSPTARNLVLEISDSKDWAAFGPNGDEASNNMFEWLHGEWKKP